MRYCATRTSDKSLSGIFFFRLSGNKPRKDGVEYTRKNKKYICMKKTAVILTIVSVFLWVVFLLFYSLSCWDGFLTCHLDECLYLTAVVTGTIAVALWVVLLVRRWNRKGKAVVWCLYGIISVFWLFYAIVAGRSQWQLFEKRYKCINDNRYLMRSCYHGWDNSYFGLSLYQREGIIDYTVCDLDWYYLPFDNPQLFVYEDADAIVLRYGMKDSIYTDVFHFNGKSYIGSAKDSVLMAVKLSEEK